MRPYSVITINGHLIKQFIRTSFKRYLKKLEVHLSLSVKVEEIFDGLMERKGKYNLLTCLISYLESGQQKS